MKISISYPPLASPKGAPLLAQNRQFQWFKDPTYIYPMVPAYAASLLQSEGHEVFWDDGIAEGLDFDAWLARLQREKPDLVAMETKTPVVKRHWAIADRIKEECAWGPRVVLMGDHVTALPRESMEACATDFVLTGGDYDFSLRGLCAALDSGSAEYPKGIWYRNGDGIADTGPPEPAHDLDSLPLIDRGLTHWELYAYKNGNFKYRPGTYIMAGRDCWWGRCGFCSWTTLYPGATFRTVSAERHVDEVGRLIRDHGVKEIFDDSGCFPRGEWLETFCRGVLDKGYGKKVRLGCNMRCGALDKDEWKLMHRAGFRFVLIGLESVNQVTLDRLNKGIQVAQIEETLRLAKGAGLEPHITIMVGYPWETRADAEETIEFARRMFSRGYVDSLQATIVVPYPGTPLFRESRERGWLLTEDWDEYDMKRSVWKSPVSNEDVLEFTRSLYRVAFSPRFMLRKLVSIRSPRDVGFLFRAARKVFAHLADFGRSGRD